MKNITILLSIFLCACKQRHENTVVEKRDSNDTIYESLFERQVDKELLNAASLDKEQLNNASILYGERCGNTGFQPKYRLELIKLIHSRDKTTIIEWVKSGVIELELYGIEGIYALQNKGEVFNESTLHMIDLITQKEGRVDVCSGCLRLGLPISELVKGIKEKYNKND